MIQLNIPVDVPINLLSEKFLPFVDWTKIAPPEIQILPAASLKYVSTDMLVSSFLNNIIATISDEDLLSIIARDIKILTQKYDYAKDSRLEGFLHNFCDKSFVMKYAKQIHAMCEMSGGTITRVKSLLYTYNALPVEKLIGCGLYSIHWSTLNSTKVPINHRYRIMKSGSYLGYTAIYDHELVEMAPVLYTQHMRNMPFMMHIPDVFDDYAINYIFQKNTNMFPGIADRSKITWNEMINLYYDGKIYYDQIEQAWSYFLRQDDIDREHYERVIGDRMPSNSVFSAEDFL